jgi:CDP-glucose 4,6-dehydratase
MNKIFSDIYKNKKILITGNTGFKGAWLTEWLIILGADVYGFSDRIPTTPSLYESIGISNRIKQYWGDLSDSEKVSACFFEVQPDIIFHLGAQALVKQSYADPIETFRTNTMGTVHVLDAFRKLTNKCILVDVTSDKCYENVEWTWGYRENDRVGGKDPYSASKGAAELVFHSFFHSFLIKQPDKRVVSVRAGNVIGGGDWAADRIVPDCIKAWAKGERVHIRSPYATRPWQHVLEPLSGYLTIGEKLFKDAKYNGESYNFGPSSNQNKSVLELLNSIASYWNPNVKTDELFTIQEQSDFHEAGLLKLICDKALHHLGWQPTLAYNETTRFTGEWYKIFYENTSPEIVKEFTHKQIKEYTTIAIQKQIEWTK